MNCTLEVLTELPPPFSFWNKCFSMLFWLSWILLCRSVCSQTCSSSAFAYWVLSLWVCSTISIFFSFLNFILKNFPFLYLRESTYHSMCVWRSRGSLCGSWFSPFAICFLGMEIRLLGTAEPSYLLSDLPSFTITCLWLFLFLIPGLMSFSLSTSVSLRL